MKAARVPPRCFLPRAEPEWDGGVPVHRYVRGKPWIITCLSGAGQVGRYRAARWRRPPAGCQATSVECAVCLDGRAGCVHRPRFFRLQRKRPFVTLDFLNPVIGNDMAAVDRVLRESLSSDVALIRQVADYIIGGGGKRLRPALLLLAANACGYAGRDHHTLAAAIEMIHTATLLHDDVVDESQLRRGHATANAHFGNPAAVLVGDFLYSRTFQLMVGVNRMRVLAIIADATNLIAEGEVLQLLHAGDAALDERAYFRVIELKTAKLFEAAGRLGGVLGDASDACEDALARYGMHLGTAFQIMDDVLDYSGEAAEIGKNLGDDLGEGKMTLP